jgi:hypothetical protein
MARKRRAPHAVHRSATRHLATYRVLGATVAVADAVAASPATLPGRAAIYSTKSAWPAAAGLSGCRPCLRSGAGSPQRDRARTVVPE